MFLFFFSFFHFSFFPIFPFFSFFFFSVKIHICFATILKALREQLKENDHLNAVEEIAGSVPEIPIEYDQILKERGRFWDDVNAGYLPEDLVLAARREKIDCVHSEGVFEIVPMQECKMQA